MFKLWVIIVRPFFSIFLLILLGFSAQKTLSSVDSLKNVLSASEGIKRIEILAELGYKYLRINNDSAIHYSLLSLDLVKKQGLKNKEANLLVTLGNAYFEKNNYAKALEAYIEADKKYELLNDEKGMIQTAMNMGLIYDVQNLFDKSLEQYNIALRRAKASGNKESYAACLNLLGALYYNKDKFKALKYFEEGLEIYKYVNNKEGIITCFTNIGVIHQERGHYDKALESFKTYLDFSRKIEDPKAVAMALHNIGLVYKGQKDYPNAIIYLDSCATVAKKINAFDDLKVTYHTLHEIYREQKKFDKALVYFELSSIAEDSLLSQTQRNELIEMSTKYQTEKKEDENKILNKEIQLKNVESSRQQLAITLIGIILAIVGIVVFILIRQNRIKQRINSELAEKNHIIEEQHKDITDSIQYSKRIQEAIMPTMNIWEETLPNSFVLYKPKDVLSGDFYWLEKTKDTIYFAACDCTGHGVPGAMVSVICSTALNRAVKEFGLKDTGQILDKVRELVLETFEKSESNVQDGMDISICGLNTKTLELKWSGANNPLWYLNNNETKEVTANKQPIGKSDNPAPFTEHKIQLAKNDIIYVFTDGYADQFGGPKGKKFKYKQLKELLMKNASKKMSEQHDILLNAFNNWKGNLEQVDDVCIIGVRV